MSNNKSDNKNSTSLPVYSTCHAMVQCQCTVLVMQQYSAGAQYMSCNGAALDSPRNTVRVNMVYCRLCTAALDSPRSTVHICTVYCTLRTAALDIRAGQQYIVLATIYCNILLPIQCIVWLKVLQYKLLLFQSIAIYCIVDLKFCNILYCCWSEVLQYIVLLN